MYNLGNSFYIVDRFLPAEHPTIADLDFATSWNMPENTVPVPGRPGCFEGTRSATPGGTVKSRIMLSCKGFTGIDTLIKRYKLTKGLKDQVDAYIADNVNNPFVEPYAAKQIKFDNNLTTSNYTISEINIIDETETFRAVNSDTYATTGQTVWTRTYTDGSTDVFIVNPDKSSFTFNGITTDSYILIINSRGAGTGNARLFEYTNIAAPTHTITYSDGGQCDISM